MRAPRTSPFGLPRALRSAYGALVACILVAVALLGALAYRDEQREFDAALDDFAEEQALVASALGSSVEARLASARRDALRFAALDPQDAGRAARAAGYLDFVVRDHLEASPRERGETVPLELALSDGRVAELSVSSSTLLEGLGGFERAGAARLLLLAPDAKAFRAGDGVAVESAPIAAALGSGASSVWLDRASAVRLGLAHRRAAAGIARIDAGLLGRFAVVIVTSAERERNREIRAEIRLISGCVVPAALVLAFGAVALRKQKQELLLARELAILDVRREREADLERASRIATLGTLAMGVAHEVSTPLGVIAGRAEQLGTRVTDERGARAVRAISDEAERIRRVVRGFLDLARGETPVLGLVDPAAILRDAAAMVDHRFAAADVEVILDIQPDLPTLHCDAFMLEQAVVNLLLNACDASPRGGRVVAAIHAERARVAFSVRDEGAGIPAEIAARVTEPFFTTKPAGKGSGLGLAIANEIVKLHHGELVLSAASPRGTNASLVIPIRGHVSDPA